MSRYSTEGLSEGGKAYAEFMRPREALTLATAEVQLARRGMVQAPRSLAEAMIASGAENKAISARYKAIMAEVAAQASKAVA